MKSFIPLTSQALPFFNPPIFGSDRKFTRKASAALQASFSDIGITFQPLYNSHLGSSNFNHRENKGEFSASLRFMFALSHLLNRADGL